MENKELFRSLVGSHNYNLNVNSSDEDCYVFLLPTFDDLYYNRNINKSLITEQEDKHYISMNTLSKHLFNTKITMLEPLFSSKTIISDDISDKSKELLNNLFEMKNQLSRMNLSSLYDSCIGMYHSNILSIKKDTVNYNFKKAVQSIRSLDFIKRFHDTNFNDFKHSIYYEDNDPMRQVLLDIKNGKYSYEEVIELATNKLEQAEKYKQIYKSYKIDNDTKDKAMNIIKELVKNNLDI